MSIKDTHTWKRLEANALTVKSLHLRDLLKDEARNKSMTAEFEEILLDYSRQCATNETLDLLFELADVAELKQKLRNIAEGAKWNNTEGRAVLHVALRAPREKVIQLDGKNVVDDVHEVLERIQTFSESVRSGSWKGVTGKPLKNVISIGIGGSYLGPEFVYEALRFDPVAKKAAEGRTLRFLANVDPVDVARATEGLNPEETLVIVVSKTFTTAETMLNARTLRNWLLKGLEGHDPKGVVSKHMAAVSTNIPLTSEFGIDPENVFGFWDWVGGRYSVCSAVGVCPLSIQYGFSVLRKFLDGAASVDEHLLNAPLRNNIPVIMGLLGVWNSSFLGHASRALLPYAQALLRFPAHIQQVDMESNGKRVDRDGHDLPFEAGEINFGEPGTNGQHSFYQLIHQGRVIPADFIGFSKSQTPVELQGETVSNHDELMSNFFAQPDALAYGKTFSELEKEGVAEELRPHKFFPGNRPSLSLLFSSLDAYTCGQLLAIYEHRTAVEGIIWNINSFDQWGVELGKVLAKKVREQLHKSRKEDAGVSGFNSSTTMLLQRYLAHKM